MDTIAIVVFEREGVHGILQNLFTIDIAQPQIWVLLHMASQVWFRIFIIRLVEGDELRKLVYCDPLLALDPWDLLLT